MRTAALRAAATVRRRRPGDLAPCNAAARGLASAPPTSPAGSGDEDGGADRPCTPWVRTVVSGVDLMRNPK